MLFPLFAVAVPGALVTTLAVAAAGGMAGWILLGKAKKVDAKLDAMQEHAIEIAESAAQEGFEILPPLLRKFAVGDIPGLREEIRTAYRIFKNDELRRSTFFAFLRKQLVIRLAEPESRQVIYEAVDEQRTLDAARERAIADKVNEATKKEGAR